MILFSKIVICSASLGAFIYSMIQIASNNLKELDISGDLFDDGDKCFDDYDSEF